MMQVLLLDEVTVDLDVVARMDLLEFLQEECDQVLSFFQTTRKILFRMKEFPRLRKKLTNEC